MSDSLRALLDCAIDYAGLFPPARLDMAAAVAAFAEYRAGEHAWALGRFVVPVARLEEFEGAAAPHLAAEGEEGAARGGKLAPRAAPWRLSAIAGTDPEADAAAVLRFNARHATGQRVDAIVDSVEARAESPADVGRVARALGGGGTQTFVELSAGGDPRPLIEAARACALRAKVRTGGTTPDAFPAPDDLARFIVACATDGLPFKATAGLHHALRGAHRLTYEPVSPSATMFGFVNVFLAAAFAHDGATEGDVARLLDEADPAALSFDDAGAAWRGRAISTESISRARRETILSFGSCSFTEPVEELLAMGLL